MLSLRSRSDLRATQLLVWWLWHQLPTPLASIRGAPWKGQRAGRHSEGEADADDRPLHVHVEKKTVVSIVDAHIAVTDLRRN
jgi:hypothetical protein